MRRLLIAGLLAPGAGHGHGAGLAVRRARTRRAGTGPLHSSRRLDGCVRHVRRGVGPQPRRPRRLAGDDRELQQRPVVPHRGESGRVASRCADARFPLRLLRRSDPDHAVGGGDQLLDLRQPGLQRRHRGHDRAARRAGAGVRHSLEPGRSERSPARRAPISLRERSVVGGALPHADGLEPDGVAPHLRRRPVPARGSERRAVVSPASAFGWVPFSSWAAGSGSPPSRGATGRSSWTGTPRAYREVDLPYTLGLGLRWKAGSQARPRDPRHLRDLVRRQQRSPRLGGHRRRQHVRGRVRRRVHRRSPPAVPRGRSASAPTTRRCRSRCDPASSPRSSACRWEPGCASPRIAPASTSRSSTSGAPRAISRSGRS